MWNCRLTEYIKYTESDQPFMYPDEFPWRRRPAWMDLSSETRIVGMVSNINPAIPKLTGIGSGNRDLLKKFDALRSVLNEIDSDGMRQCDPAVTFEQAHLARDYLNDIRSDLDEQSDDDMKEIVDAVDTYLLLLPRKFRGRCDCNRARR